MRPVDPTLGFPLAPLLRDMQDAIREQAVPTKPVQLATVNFADLPPAEDWKGCIIHVLDHSCVAVSTFHTGVWAWKKADGSSI